MSVFPVKIQKKIQPTALLRIHEFLRKRLSWQQVGLILSGCRPCNTIQQEQGIIQRQVKFMVVVTWLGKRVCQQVSILWSERLICIWAGKRLVQEFRMLPDDSKRTGQDLFMTALFTSQGDSCRYLRNLPVVPLGELDKSKRCPVCNIRRSIFPCAGRSGQYRFSASRQVPFPGTLPYRVCRSGTSAYQQDRETHCIQELEYYPGLFIGRDEKENKSVDGGCQGDNILFRAYPGKIGKNARSNDATNGGIVEIRGDTRTA